MMSQATAGKDFFISYTRADRAWAEWIAFQLEEAGYTTILQAWDFRPGSNFVIEMDTASRIAERSLAVLSSHYFQSGFTLSEWATAFRHDPKGEQHLLVPVRVQLCDVQGLLGSIIYINLVGLEEQEARTALLEGVRRQRAKPSSVPFPREARVPTPPPAFPNTLPSVWTVPY